MKNCRLCNQPFEPTHWRQEYCSREHSAQANYDRAARRNKRIYNKKRKPPEYLVCANGVEVKNNILGYLMRWGTNAGY